MEGLGPRKRREKSAANSGDTPGLKFTLAGDALAPAQVPGPIVGKQFVEKKE